MHALAAACLAAILQLSNVLCRATATHYSNSCASDEVAGEVMGETGQVCVPRCNEKTFDCPSDVPEGTTAQPQCMLSDIDRAAYCGLLCETDNQCPSGAICRRAAALEVGLCIHQISFTEWAQQGARRKLDIGLPSNEPEKSRGWELAKAYQALMSLKFNHAIADGDADILVVEEMLSNAHQLNQAKTGSSPSTLNTKLHNFSGNKSKGYSELLCHVILIFVIYIAVGSAYKYHTVGVCGFAMIPHYKFWREYPSLIGDGMRYLIVLIAELYSMASSTNYSRGKQSFNLNASSSFDQL